MDDDVYLGPWDDRPDDLGPDDADDDRDYAYAMSAWDPRRKVWIPVPERRDA